MKHWQDCELPDNNLFPEPYNIIEPVSESSTSSVLIGFDESADFKVIIKCFKNSAKGAYLREISAAYDMKHQYLVRCLNTFNRKDGQSCLVYEYLPGGNLADLLEVRGKLGVDLIFQCLTDVLKALIYLHAQSRIHCDIKPANVFLRPNSTGQFDFVLGDLGAACFLREAQEGFHVTGTPAYIAPERIRNQFFSNSDLYSLGVLAFELYTGNRPFLGSVEEITQANLTDVPSLEAIEYQPLRDLIDLLLAKSPQKRIESASLAYLYLNKLQRQQLESRSLRTVSASHPTINPGLRHSLKPVSSMVTQLNVTLDNKVLAIHCFHTSERLLVGLTYAGHTDVIDPVSPDSIFKTLLHTHSVQVTGAATIVYSTPSRIQAFDFETMTPTTYIEKINNPKKFYYKDNKLIFVDDFNLYFVDLQDNSNFSFRSSSYLFNPIISMVENGCVYLSEGMVNEKLVKRDKTGAIQAEWQIDGPISAMTDSVDHFILGASLSVNDQNSYSIWCLLEQGHINKQFLNERIKQISCTQDSVLWLTEAGDLQACSEDLNPKLIGKFSSNTAKFAASKDGLYICTLDFDGPNQAIIKIFNKGEA